MYADCLRAMRPFLGKYAHDWFRLLTCLTCQPIMVSSGPRVQSEDERRKWRCVRVCVREGVAAAMCHVLILSRYTRTVGPRLVILLQARRLFWKLLCKVANLLNVLPKTACDPIKMFRLCGQVQYFQLELMGSTFRARVDLRQVV